MCKGLEVGKNEACLRNGMPGWLQAVSKGASDDLKSEKLTCHMGLGDHGEEKELCHVCSKKSLEGPLGVCVCVCRKFPLTVLQGVVEE